MKKPIKPIYIKPSKRRGIAVAAQRRHVYHQQNKRRAAPTADEWDDSEED